MKAKFLALAIVLGMSAPMFANGVQVDFTIRGDYSAVVTEGDYIEIVEANNVTWVLSICYDPNTPGSVFSDSQSTFGIYDTAIQNWTVSNPFGFLTPTFIAGGNTIEIQDNFDNLAGGDGWGALADGFDNGNFTGFFALLMRSNDNPLASGALVPPWSVADFVTRSLAFGFWSGNIDAQFVEADWEGEIIDIRVTMKGVPEPATLTLLAAGLLAGAAFRKRFK